MKKDKLPIPRVLTNSLRNLWTTCHRRFHYRVIEGLETIVKRRALHLGTLYHTGLAAHYLGQSTGGAIDGKVAEYINSLEDLDDDMAAQAALEEVRDIQHKAHLLVERYVAHWAGFDQWEVQAVETPLELRLLTPSGNPSHWKYTGIPDLVVLDRSDDRIKIVDWKTTSRVNREGYQAELELDPQSRGYCLLWWMGNNMDHSGEIDFIFDVQRSALPAEPKTLVCKKCNAKLKKDPTFKNPECPTCAGTNVSGLSKAQGIDTTVAIYKAALEQYPHVDAAEYQDVFTLLEAKADSWLYRIELNYERAELEDFAAESYEVTREIAEANYWTRNFSACFAPGRVCVFRHLCLAEGNASKQAEARAAFRVMEPGAPELRDHANGSDMMVAAVDAAPF